MRLACLLTSALALCGCSRAARPPSLGQSEGPASTSERASRSVSSSTPEAASTAHEQPPSPPETSTSEPEAAGAHERPEARPEPSGKAPQTCVGRPRPASKTPRAACCYPSKAPIVAAIDAIRPSLSPCVALMHDDVDTVAVRISVGPSGAPDDVCTDALPQRSPSFVQCVLHGVQSARFPASSPEQEELCGTLKLVYPLRFEKPRPVP